jgi:hypothetical protein
MSKLLNVWDSVVFLNRKDRDGKSLKGIVTTRNRDGTYDVCAFEDPGSDKGTMVRGVGRGEIVKDKEI